MSSCSYRNCPNINCKKNNIALFCLPKKLEIRNQWIRNSGAGSVNNEKSFKICETHFDKNCISYSFKRKRLALDSIPNPFGLKNLNSAVEDRSEGITCAEENVSEYKELRVLRTPTGTNKNSNLDFNPGSKDIAEELLNNR